MTLPIFFIAELNDKVEQITLPEEVSRHMSQVLRMQSGRELILTDGQGKKYTCTLTDNNKKKCLVAISQKEEITARPYKNTIAISPIKNAGRFEWFLEKAAELGLDEIVPLLCENTEKAFLKNDRIQNILVSAMAQSQQFFLTKFSEPVRFNSYINSIEEPYLFIAHCREDADKLPFSGFTFPQPGNKIILIGPEGDFTEEEIARAKDRNFRPVTLGNTRLRSETAGVYAAVTIMQE